MSDEVSFAVVSLKQESKNVVVNQLAEEILSISNRLEELSRLTKGERYQITGGLENSATGLRSIAGHCLSMRV